MALPQENTKCPYSPINLDYPTKKLFTTILTLTYMSTYSRHNGRLYNIPEYAFKSPLTSQPTPRSPEGCIQPPASPPPKARSSQATTQYDVRHHL